jgi:hypothetical protein
MLTASYRTASRNSIALLIANRPQTCVAFGSRATINAL